MQEQELAELVSLGFEEADAKVRNGTFLCQRLGPLSNRRQCRSKSLHNWGPSALKRPTPRFILGISSCYLLERSLVYPVLVAGQPEHQGPPLEAPPDLALVPPISCANGLQTVK